MRRDALFHCGVRFAPLFHAFVRFAVDQARAQGHRQLYFFTREGEFFRAIHESIIDASREHGLPAAQLLEVSRRSTFAASLHEVTPGSLMRLWTLYSTQSIRALLASLNLSAHDYESDIVRHGLTVDERIVHPWADGRVAAFLADASVKARLEGACAGQRDRLRTYCRERGIHEHAGRVAVVDIGWRGTIQDNLAYVFPTVTFEGAYLGLLRYLNPQPVNATKVAFGPDENTPEGDVAQLLRFVTPYEMVTNSASGTVTGYEAGRYGMRAVRANNDGEDAVFRQCTEAFQDGVLHAIPELELSPEIRTDRRREAMRLLEALSFDPPRPLAAAYLALAHDETFGVGEVVQKRAERPTALMLKAVVSRDARVRLERWLDETTWPAGVVKAYRLRPLMQLALRRQSLRPAGNPFDLALESRASRRRWRSVVRELENRRVCCYGAGAFASAVLRNRDLSRLNVVAFVDRDATKVGRSFGGYPIVSAEDVARLNPDVVLMTVFRNPGVVMAVETLVRNAGLTCPVRADVWE